MDPSQMLGQILLRGTLLDHEWSLNWKRNQYFVLCGALEHF